MRNPNEAPLFARKPADQKFSNGVYGPSRQDPLTMVDGNPDRTRIALPSGRLEREVVDFFKAIGLKFSNEDRKYFVPVENMPVDFVFIKANAVPSAVRDLRSNIVAGVTGSDILWDQQIDLLGGALPVSSLVENATNPRLYVGITKKLADQIKKEEGRQPEPKDLSGKQMVSKYRWIPSNYVSMRGLRGVSYTQVNGTEEAYQYVVPRFEGVLGVIDSGKSARVNGIVPLEEFYNITVQLVQAMNSSFETAEKLTTRDMQILDDLREMTYVALQKKGTGI